ncbi:hypothetical protein BOG92_043945 [Streptomyces sp. WAC00263]|nr:hypothetical protein BOG92_043945 [Streptomyces sp. WAC00263]
MAVPVSGVWCVQLQGGGGKRRGASLTDDNAADVRARPRVCGMIGRTGPRRCAGCGTEDRESRHASRVVNGPARLRALYPNARHPR